MRIDAYGMRHLPVKQNEMEMRASVDMNLRKERSAQEQRDLEERRRRQEEEDERRKLTDAESKARAAAGGQQKVARSPEERERFQTALANDNLLRQAMIDAAQAYSSTRDKMLDKAAGFLKANPQFAGLQSGEGPLFELRGAAANPAWRLGRGVPPQSWEVVAHGEQIRLVDPRSGQLRSEWDGARWLGKDLTRRVAEADGGSAGTHGPAIRVRWTTVFPTPEESALELFELPLPKLADAAQTEAVRRFNSELLRRSQESLREQPPPSPEGARGPVAMLGIVDGKLAPLDARQALTQGTPAATSPPPTAEVQKNQFAALLATRSYDKASNLLRSVSAGELAAAQQGVAPAASLAVELLKLARDHIQRVGADSAPDLVATSRQVIEDQRRARGPR